MLFAKRGAVTNPDIGAPSGMTAGVSAKCVTPFNAAPAQEGNRPALATNNAYPFSPGLPTILHFVVHGYNASANMFDQTRNLMTVA